MTSLRIGFDVSQAGPGRAGCGVVAHELARALRGRPGCRLVPLPCFGGHVLPEDAPEDVPGLAPGEETGPRLPDHEASLEYWRSPRLEESLAPLRLDVVHANNFFAPRGLRRTRLVTTLYDLAFLARPEWSTEANRVACFDGVFTAAVVADLVVAISEASRRHFLGVFPHYPEDRTAVVGLGSRFADGSIAPRRPAALPEELAGNGFLLTVGTLEPRKNHRLLLQALDRYRDRRADPLPLVVAGGSGWLTEGLEDELAERRDVRFLGYVGDPELLWLYRHARLLVYPSAFEGFGLPVLEAMGEGTPVVATAATSLPEVVGDGGVLVPPGDPEALAGALEAAHDPDRHEHLAARARVAAARFSWERAADRLVELYREVSARPKLAESPA